jgi:hypothetical protein
MMDRETALNTLRLPADADHSQIVSAYGRLARRYPLQQFPERHTRLLQAKTLLLNPETAFKDILTEDTVNLSWLNRYATGETANSGRAVESASAEPNLKQCLEAMLRPHLISNADSFSRTGVFDFGDELGRMVEELGIEGIQGFIDKIGFD